MTDTSTRFTSYPADAALAKFLLGGIGTGNFSIGSRGQFCDFEFFGQAGKGNALPFAFPALWCQADGEEPVARVLEAELRPPHDAAHGHCIWEAAGLPRLHDSRIQARMPFVTVDFLDDSLPVQVSLTAFTPFIPLNADDSGIPAALLRYRLINRCERRVRASVALTMPNVSGYLGAPKHKFSHDCPELSQRVRNAFWSDERARGLVFTCEDEEHPRLLGNSLALLTTAQDFSCLPEWLEGGWFDGMQDFWSDFCGDGRLSAERPEPPLRYRNTFPALKMGSVCASVAIEPGQSAEVEFCLAWYFPVRESAWADLDPRDNETRLMRHFYATKFADALDAARYLLGNLPRLERDSRLFSDALYGSTLPAYVIEAAADNLTALRSPSCMRIEGGAFLGWEGCFGQGGCCEGTCAHVWNYAQSAAFLFPGLEISARRVDFLLETDEGGHMTYRTQRVFGQPRWDYMPAADGQAGTLIRLYREWKLTGDDAFLREVWPMAKASLRFLFEHFDTDGDLLPDAEQHNTYDTEFFGPNPLVCSLTYGAVAAMREMARYLGEEGLADRLEDVFRRGARRFDELLWNGEYYVQRLSDLEQYRCQHGDGCLSDQLFGQFLAFVTGLGYLLPKAHVKKALKSVYDYNFRKSFRGAHAIGRTYALGNESGLLICTWPKGGRPRFPFFYADEVWTGVEYQVAASLIYAGLVRQGLDIVRAVRARHDGVRRGPWCEVECGFHYARAMSSWSLITALSGFSFDMTSADKWVAFEPRIQNQEFRTFFSTGLCWGIYEQSHGQNGQTRREIKVLYGDKSVRLE